MSEFSINISKERRKYLIKLGLNSDHTLIWSSKYGRLRDRAKYNGIEFNLSFNDYVNMAVEAGINSPDQIGRNSGKYCVGRIGDLGGYTNGNCRFITTDHNHKEAVINGAYKRSSEKLTGRKNVSHSEFMTGKNKSNDIRMKILSDSMTGKTKLNDARVARMAFTKSKRFILKSPLGLEYIGYNLTQFCRDNDLCQTRMSSLCRGEMKQVNGWTGMYLEKEVDVSLVY